MSLLIDQDFVTQTDLLAIDPEVADVADAEEITLTGPGSIVSESWNEVCDELLNAMQAFGGDIIAWPGTLTTYGAFGISRPRLRLNQIVVDVAYAARHSILYRWMIYRSLTMFYREAANRRTSDRYELKWERFEKETGKHWRNLFATGLPMVALPLACPGALHEFQSGFWADTNVTTAAGGTDPGNTYDVAITWVDGTQYASPLLTNNAESGPSTIVTQVVAANTVLSVSIAGLNPPSAQSAMLRRGIADGPYITRTASGWNVYVGPSGGLLALQNASPIPLGTQTFTLPNAPVAGVYGAAGVGAVLMPGQFPDANYTFMRVLQRG